MPNVGNCGEVYYVTPDVFPAEFNVLGPNAIWVKSDIALNRFLHHLFQCKEFQDKLYKIVSPVGQTKFNKTNFKELTIPVPPLPVQSEIVRILDNFTELTAELTVELTAELTVELTAELTVELTAELTVELTVELTARKSQYAYYQDKLLTRSAGTIHTLGECCVSIADGDHQPPPKADSGIPFITISNFTENGIDFTGTKFVPQEYYDKLDKKRRAQKDDILYSVVGSFGIPVHITEDKPFVFQRHIAILRPNTETIAPRYLYHVMKSDAFYKKADAAAIGAAQRTISLSALNRMKISVPSLEVQERLVRVLDNFDAICTDLNIGLPAEIEARKKSSMSFTVISC